MHSRKELAEMERREKEEKARHEVDAVKRRLVFEKEEKKKEENKKEEQGREENSVINLRFWSYGLAIFINKRDKK